MINTKHLIKVASAWISVVYAVCYAAVALFPALRPAFMEYGLHVNVKLGQNVFTFGTFIIGLIMWNVIAVLSVWLFAYLFNKVRH